MTQEEKQLLLKDLCARLPYGVMAYASEINKNGIITDVNIPYNMVNLTVDNTSGKYELVPLFDIKPYLRPLSSMTEEEKNEIKALGAEFSSFGSIRFRIEERENDGFEYGYKWLDIFDFLNRHYFDYRSLIPMGLALKAPEGMYKTE